MRTIPSGKVTLTKPVPANAMAPTSVTGTPLKDDGTLTIVSVPV